MATFVLGRVASFGSISAGLRRPSRRLSSNRESLMICHFTKRINILGKRASREPIEYHLRVDSKRAGMTMGAEESTHHHQLSKLDPLLDPPTFLSITVPPQSLVGFEADFEHESATWPRDLATTTDYHTIQEFVTSAHALVRRWLPREVVSRLETLLYDANHPPALVIRGLPIDKDLPPTGPEGPLRKTGKFMSETWLIGICRIIGQPFTFDFLRGTRSGMGLLTREIFAKQDKVDLVSAEGSRKLLDFHVDLYQVVPEFFPTIAAFIGLRGDPDKRAKTILCDFRILYRKLDPSDIAILRTHKITWGGVMGGFTTFVIQGSEEHPEFVISDETIAGLDDVPATGSLEVVAAYKRLKEVANKIGLRSEGVWLDGGDVLIFNQTEVAHERTPYTAKFDGNDRWMQRCYTNNGSFWQPSRLVEWPNRSLKLLGSSAVDQKSL